MFQAEPRQALPDSVSLSACDYRTRLAYVMTVGYPRAHNFLLRRPHVS